MHPILRDDASLETFHNQGSEEMHYYAKNAAGDRIGIDHQTLEALLHADGTHPLDLPDNGEAIISELKNKGIIQTSRLSRDDSGDSFFILIPFREHSPKRNKICKLINAVFPFVSILTFALGIYCKVTSPLPKGDDSNVFILLISAYLLSTAFHELGHIIAGFAYGYRMTELGVRLYHYVPLTVYVGYEDDMKNTTKKEQLQFTLAGAEGELVFAGIALLISALYAPLSCTAFVVALMTLGIMIFNLIPMETSDGEEALSLLLNVPSIYSIADEYVTNKDNGKKLAHSGAKGFLRLCFLKFVYHADKMLWLLPLLFIAGVIVYLTVLFLGADSVTISWN